MSREWIIKKDRIEIETGHYEGIQVALGEIVDQPIRVKEVNEQLDKAIAETQTFLECCVDDKHNRISPGLKRYAEGLLAQYRLALKESER